jgi:hypothetical protein
MSKFNFLKEADEPIDYWLKQAWMQSQAKQQEEDEQIRQEIIRLLNVAQSGAELTYKAKEQLIAIQDYFFSNPNRIKSVFNDQELGLNDYADFKELLNFYQNDNSYNENDRKRWLKNYASQVQKSKNYSNVKKLNQLSTDRAKREINQQRQNYSAVAALPGQTIPQIKAEPKLVPGLKTKHDKEKEQIKYSFTQKMNPIPSVNQYKILTAKREEIVDLINKVEKEVNQEEKSKETAELQAKVYDYNAEKAQYDKEQEELVRQRREAKRLELQQQEQPKPQEQPKTPMFKVITYRLIGPYDRRDFPWWEGWATDNNLSVTMDDKDDVLISVHNEDRNNFVKEFIKKDRIPDHEWEIVKPR